ncbi:MAG: ribosomal RNA small subunit methyltransferase A [Euryarchaeota archaeon]|nr:ribosomal RNA small subunit methyltransferase A [Euryarchaeota archaeon]MBT6845509.1 ribosomal RNA small subunit methyltransferase A [Euryarchaeota archaeon]MBT7063542.1 ribosomal RNA small subunit methyltransferase A [Euryarchaeota archaeon]HJL97668.1 16S rRNA (adenine(1518)-N(6)/adenine(1519)-N(6))-dimethyltransferase RsmA [Candidatus Poseidoniaceae archaeon]
MRGARWLIDSLRDKLPFDKSLGQHFLVNDDLIAQAIELGDVSQDDHVLEIGPGPGVLTEALLATGCQVTAIEIDSVAVTHLNEAFGPEQQAEKFNLLEGDALNLRWPDSITKVVANIPYQISSPLVDELTRYLRNPRTTRLEKVVLLVQEEFAERLVMEYESDVGSLGMTVSLDWECEIEGKVAPHNFSPMPKVNSCYISMEPHDEEWACDVRLVRQMIHLAFDQRRKKLRSTLKNVPRRLGRVKGWHAGRWKHAFAAHLDDERMDLRPDELELEDWIELCCSFSELEFES